MRHLAGGLAATVGRGLGRDEARRFYTIGRHGSLVAPGRDPTKALRVGWRLARSRPWTRNSASKAHRAKTRPNLTDEPITAVDSSI